MFAKLKLWLVGKPKDLEDPELFHSLTLIAFLAWVGLGADGLSSSAYGPEEAFKALHGHWYLAIFLAMAVAITVFVISLAYTGIIEHFPSGGGGYVVSTKLLGDKFGLISGAALLIDYILTITVSIASGVEAIFSSLPAHQFSLFGYEIDISHSHVAVEIGAIVLLIILNLRGLKESINVLVPVFLLFLATHAVMLGSAFFMKIGELPHVASTVSQGIKSGLSDPSIGFIGLFLIFIHAYSMGAGTFTGIEAVSNGLQIMREPRVKTGKRTMLYMALSLSITAGGILLAYLLFHVGDVEAANPGMTLNAVLLKQMTSTWTYGRFFLIVTLLAEAALLTVAAQTGFIDGPRVMANMALDSWLPHRFSALSERLTMHYGILLLGVLSIGALLYSGGNVDTLVTMYSINVFITFSLSTFGMCKFYFTERKKREHWKKGLTIQLVAFVLCFTILCINIVVKFWLGAWLTLVVTSLLIALCLSIKNYYKKVIEKLGLLSVEVEIPPISDPPPEKMDIKKSTAVLLVGGYGGLGVHALAQVIRLFPDHFTQIVFVSVGIIDSGNFKGAEETERLKKQTEETLLKYEALARRFGLAADSMMLIGQDPVAGIEELCVEVALRYPKSTFFAGQLVFQRDAWYQRLLHNETAYAVQRRLQWQGLPMVVLPVRVWGAKKKARTTGMDL